MRKWIRVGTSAALLAPVAAFAEGAPGEAVFTALGTEAATYITAGFTLLAVVLGGTLGMKLVKKILSRAT